MKRFRQLHLLSLSLVGMAVAVAGCGPKIEAEPSSPVSVVDVSADSVRDTLRDDIDAILAWTHENRHLNLKDHAAWQILHGALTYKRDFLIEREDGQRVSAIDHLLQGGTMKGWVARPGTYFEATGRRGLQMVLEVGSKTGQGHVDQWLAILSQCELPPTQTILLEGETYTMQDLVAQALWDVPRNVQQEYSWTIVGLTAYLPTDYSWVAQDGQTWSIEKLMAIESEQDIHDAACGGTHRLSGMSVTLNRHLAAGGKLEGGWALAEQRIQEFKQAARQYQNADGSFSSNYLARPGNASDLSQRLGSSGHVFEFLTIASTDAELHEPGMVRGALHLCKLLKETKKIDLECGALYHATNGLRIYRNRVYGEKSPGTAKQAVAHTDDAASQDLNQTLNK